MRERLIVTPARFRTAAWTALVSLTLIVFTGAAVRLTDSGLGCEDWPRCSRSHLTPPDQLHAFIEFGNRSLSGIVGFVTVVVMVMAFMRRPLRRDLAVLATLLPLGVVAQAVLGGYTVKEKLAPGFVMGHFGLSMLILVAAVALVWRCYYPAGTRPRTFSRALVWTIHQHATIAFLFGIATIVAWLLKRRQTGTLDPTEPLTVLGILIAAQGLVGEVQYEMKLPGEMVWVHVGLATATWVVALWAWADTGRAAPLRRSVDLSGSDGDLAEPRELETVRF